MVIPTLPPHLLRLELVTVAALFAAERTHVWVPIITSPLLLTYNILVGGSNKQKLVVINDYRLRLHQRNYMEDQRRSCPQSAAFESLPTHDEDYEISEESDASIYARNSTTSATRIKCERYLCNTLESLNG
jgi:hypothetical protein